MRPIVMTTHPRDRHWFLVGLVLAAVALRLFPHPWNFTPIGAVALFGGATFRHKGMAFGIPVLAMLLSDGYLGFHRLMPFVYGSFLVTTCLGIWARRRGGAGRVVAASVMGTMVFFVVTNFGVWACLDSYPGDALGLWQCFVAGLPFLRNGLLGDLFYTAVLFGGLEWAQYRLPRRREQESRVPATTLV
jgi:hypothetical protein